MHHNPDNSNESRNTGYSLYIYDSAFQKLPFQF